MSSWVTHPGQPLLKMFGSSLWEMPSQPAHNLGKRMAWIAWKSHLSCDQSWYHPARSPTHSSDLVLVGLFPEIKFNLKGENVTLAEVVSKDSEPSLGQANVWNMLGQNAQEGRKFWLGREISSPGPGVVGRQCSAGPQDGWSWEPSTPPTPSC